MRWVYEIEQVVFRNSLYLKTLRNFIPDPTPPMKSMPQPTFCSVKFIPRGESAEKALA